MSFTKLICLVECRSNTPCRCMSLLPDGPYSLHICSARSVRAGQAKLGQNNYVSCIKLPSHVSSVQALSAPGKQCRSFA